MRSSRQGTTAATIVFTLLASLLVHLVMWPLGDRVLAMSWTGMPLPLTGGVMEVALVGQESEDEEQDDKEEEQLPEQLPPELRGKLVNLDRLLDQTPPEQTDFLSEFDNTVEHQTKAPNQHPIPGAAPMQPGQSPNASNQNPSQPRPPSPSQALALGERMGAGATGAGRQADALGVNAADEGVLPHDPGAAGSPQDPGMRGIPNALRQTFGAPGTLDDINGVDEGSENLLSSKRWRFASFFNRVRNAVAQHWHPEVVHAARDPEGRIYGTKTRITRLRIRLNRDGSVRQIRLEAPSGVDYLDEEAIRSVRTAQPFNNPPPQLVDPSTGFIDFGFGFIFEINGRPRIFRYRN